MGNNPIQTARMAFAAENMSDAHHVAAPGATRLRYLICSSERSGSSMLADKLAASDLAGRPMEYFNQLYMNHYAVERQLVNVDINAYLNYLQAKRTTANGVFGIKAHLKQLVRVFGPPQEATFQQLLRSFDRLVYIERGDKLAQAISLYRARATGFWTSKYEAYLTKPVASLVFNPRAIAAALNDVVREHEDWLAILNGLGLKFLHVRYEDIVANPSEFDRLLKHLGINAVADDLPKPRLSQQRDDRNGELKALFLQFIAGHG